MVTANLPAPWRHQARYSDRHGWVQAQGLVEDGEQVLERQHAVEGNLLVPREHRQELVGDLAHGVGVAEQEPRSEAEGGGRGLGARDNKQVGVLHELVARQGQPGLVGAQHRVDKIRAVRHRAQPLVQLGVDVADVLLDLARRHAAEDGVDELKGPGDDAPALHDVRVELDPLEDDGDPGVQGAALEAAKGLAEGQVADDVKGGVVVPEDHVDGDLLVDHGLLAEALDQQIDIAHDDGLLVEQARGREAVGQDAAQGAVVLAAGADQAVFDVEAPEAERVLFVLQHASRDVAHDLPPCVRAQVRELVRGHPDDVAVLLVQLQDPLVGVAAQPVSQVGQPARGPELGAGVLSQGVEKEVVYRLEYDDVQESTDCCCYHQGQAQMRRLNITQQSGTRHDGEGITETVALAM